MIFPGSSLIYFGWQLFFRLFQMIIFNQMTFPAKITQLTLELGDKDLSHHDTNLGSELCILRGFVLNMVLISLY